MNYTFRSKDCPGADGKEPKYGDAVHSMTVPLDDGGKLTLHIGDKGRQALLDMLGMQKEDDERDFQAMTARLLMRLPDTDPLVAAACDLIRRKGVEHVVQSIPSSFYPTGLSTHQGLRDAAECIIGHVPEHAYYGDGLERTDAFSIDEKLWVAAVMIAGRWLFDGPDQGRRA